MSDDITPSQERALLRLLDKVMEVMRDDRPLEPDDPAFGELESAAFFKLAEAGKTYTFRNNAFPDATVDLTTWTDPLDYSDDRTRVQAVPAYFNLWFQHPPAGINRRLLEQRLDLANYRVDADGRREEGNDLGHSVPPATLLHTYRYRANDGEHGRFPVDVEFFFLDALPNDLSSKVLLIKITIVRAYPYLTPAMRKKKREEQNQKKRQTYGYMNLCTDAPCPESGVWEGWTKDGPTDVMRFERGQKFDAVRTVSLEQGGSCPMVPGQWFWLCSINEETGTVWKGIALKG
ncbi:MULTISPECIES: hypothetical protein [Paraburkholderia]|uniref:Uncharacterized protein n=1 Tax=Paraburkholderia caledonica TaxID=134536 RepID=A0ABU1KY64_9BURK|nr:MULTISPECIES: hypothetical protein [Paraburkholderia]MDR6375853.1 hypothetical protein [Paraburkholderia caledonica]MDR7003854.1 hypothetical protein [Paraburkholderia strydomiana]